MATRSVEQIQKELAKTDKQSENLLKKQMASISGSLKAEEAGLKAQQKQAFGQILGGAKQRGLKFSGIPLAEQAEFTSTQFLPALARLRQGGQDQRFGLQSALADIVRQRGLSAQGIFQQEQDRAAANSRAAASRAAQQNSTTGIMDVLNRILTTQGAGGSMSDEDQRYLDYVSRNLNTANAADRGALSPVSGGAVPNAVLDPSGSIDRSSLGLNSQGTTNLGKPNPGKGFDPTRLITAPIAPVPSLINFLRR